MVSYLGLALAIAGAALAALLSGIGSAKGVGMVGQAAAGLISEDPSKFTKVLILEILPGTQGLYGFITAIMVMIKIQLLSGNPIMLTPQQGIAVFVACLPMAIVGYFSALHQAKVAAAGVSVVAKKPDQQSKAMVLSAMVETYAVLALLTSLLFILRLSF
ncbi:MAG: V-type ATP synthase subunit K [Clostridiaceae bacterium]|jgi:V/A-type H+-transporting ATPase subunit K|nr:V-type ATP synthase subunit K [Clostridiaceae bacterium]